MLVEVAQAIRLRGGTLNLCLCAAPNHSRQANRLPHEGEAGKLYGIRLQPAAELQPCRYDRKARLKPRAG